MWLSRAAAIAALVAAGALLWTNLSTSTVTVATTDNGTSVSLEDGSMVFLDKESTIDFPEKFSKSGRDVTLDGVAYFDVEPDAERSFRVRTDKATITVLGTEFGVEENDAEGIVSIYVTEGKVRVMPEGSETYLNLTAGQSAMFDQDTRELSRQRDADLNDVAWHTKRLTFRDTPLSEVIEDLEKTYDVTILLENTSLESCPFSSSYESEDLDSIFQDMEMIWGIKAMSPEEGSYLLKGGNCD